MQQGLALNLQEVLFNMGHGHGITKDDIVKQDMSYLDGRLDRIKKMMRKHSGKNRDWDPESKPMQLAEVDHPKFDPNTSRQVRRQMERRVAKFARTHKFGKKTLKYGERVVRYVDPDTKLVKHQIGDINMIVLTHVSTTRYIGHIGKNQTASLGGYADIDFIGK